MKDGFLSPPEFIDDEEKDHATKPDYQPLIDNSAENRRFGFWGNLRLASKFLLAFGVLFVFALVITAVTLNGLNRTQAAYEEALAEGIEIRGLSEQLEASLLQARSNEKNFLLHWREEGFFTANRNYVIPYTQNIADMRTQLELLAALGRGITPASTDSITQTQYEADIASLRQNVDAYEKSFKALVNAFQKKGFDEETDFESQFRTAARIIEAKATGQAGLENTFLRLRLSEKNYLADASQSYTIDIHTLIPLFKNRIVESDRLNPEDKAELLKQTDAYLTAFDALVELDKEIAGHNKDLIIASSAVEALTAEIKSLGEQLAIKSIEEARSNSTQTFTTSSFTVLVALVVSILLAVTFSQQLTRPLILLTRIAQEISEGNFRMYAEVNSADEIGNLTKTINDMTVQLQNALRNLESRAEKLKEQASQLTRAGHQSSRRAQQLQTIAEIARYILTEKDLNKLLPLITKTVSEEFGFYHVGIFLLDDSGKSALLLAANSPGGQKMLQRQHSLEVGQTGIVGNVAATGVPRIASDTGKDAVYFNNPDLPETRSELALPLKIEERVIGALDIQSIEVNAFSEEDFEALTTLADQVSIAIENARLFNQIEKSLAEADAIQRQYSRETWGRLSREEKISGYRYSIAGVVPLNEESESTLSKVNKNRREVSVPITLRGEAIGTLTVQSPMNEHISPDQMDLVKAVAERVAISAENARLFDETTRRAEREHLVSDITTKIRSTTDPQEMVRTAVEELKRALGVTHVEVVPQKTVSPPDK